MRLFQLIFWHVEYDQEDQEIASPRLSRLRGEEEAYDYAEFWILTNPDDIVMLVEVELDVCKNCSLPIQEKPGWVLHKWIHIRTQAYTCLNAQLTKAEPKGPTHA